jgi:hypothetical protein
MSFTTAIFIENALRIIGFLSFFVAVGLELIGYFQKDKKWKQRLEFSGLIFFLVLAASDALAFVYERRARELSVARVSFSSETHITFRHNLGTSAPQITCFDAAGNQFEPGLVQAIDSNTAIISIAVPMPGTCTAK